ncbi:MAG: AI-2E family transporter, partial [Candidatus Nanoarchaeia archaeon]
MKGYFKYIYVLFFLVVLSLSFLIIQPFLSALILGCLIAYIFYPVFTFVEKRLKHKHLSALIVSIFIILLFSLPSFILVDSAGKEAQFFYIRAKQKLATGKLVDFKCEPGYKSIPCMATDKVKEWFENPAVKRYTDEILGKFSAYVVQQGSAFVFKLPKLLMDLFVAFFVSFYLFVDGERFAARFKKLVPVNPRYQKEVYKKIDTITHGVIY